MPQGDHKAGTIDPAWLAGRINGYGWEGCLFHVFHAIDGSELCLAEISVFAREPAYPV